MKSKFKLLLLCIICVFPINAKDVGNGIYCDKNKKIYLLVCEDEFVYIYYSKWQDLRPLHSIARGKINKDSCFLTCSRHKDCNLDVSSPLYELSPFCDAALQGNKIHYIARHGKIKKVELVYRQLWSLKSGSEYIKIKKVKSTPNHEIKKWINNVVDSVFYQEKMKWIEPLK